MRLKLSELAWRNLVHDKVRLLVTATGVVFCRSPHRVQTERVNTKILETLIERSDGHELPLGLRVQAFIR